MPSRIDSGGGDGQGGSAREPLPVSARVREAGALLPVDLATTEVAGLFEAAGVRSILLKGPSFRRWLYPGGGRLYSDTDLLVAPASAPRARKVLAGAGFEPVEVQRVFEDPKHALGWQRPRDGASVDLHVAIKGARVPPEEIWRILSARTELLDLHGRRVEVLDEPARLLHVVLHAGQHGSSLPQPLEDLRRAVRDVGPVPWSGAVELARELDALEAFRRGLAVVEDGARVAEALGLEPWRPGPPTTEEILLAEAPAEPVVAGIERLGRVRGAAAKVAFVVHKAFSREAVTIWAPAAAERGGAWLFAARVVRPLWLLVHLPGALVRLARAARASRRAGRGGA